MSSVPAPRAKQKHRIYESKGEPFFQAFLILFFALLRAVCGRIDRKK